MPDKAPPPWIIRDSGEAFWIEDASGQKFGFCYYDDPPLVGTSNPARLTKDLARRLVANFAKLPDLLRKLD